MMKSRKLKSEPSGAHRALQISMAQIVDRVPAMTDKELGNLRDNAERMIAAGKPAESAAATELLPSLTSEIDARKAKRKVDLAEARSAARNAKPPIKTGALLAHGS